ncbi:MAG: hypothetical protein KAJ14_11675, partial [Candidatus Omnitrophica bacterium]|nr:hypothetical protein [Candidatus Omnitrophota bacterium]
MDLQIDNRVLVYSERIMLWTEPIKLLEQHKKIFKKTNLTMVLGKIKIKDLVNHRQYIELYHKEIWEEEIKEDSIAPIVVLEVWVRGKRKFKILKGEHRSIYSLDEGIEEIRAHIIRSENGEDKIKAKGLIDIAEVMISDDWNQSNGKNDGGEGNEFDSIFENWSKSAFSLVEKEYIIGLLKSSKLQKTFLEKLIFNFKILGLDETNAKILIARYLFRDLNKEVEDSRVDITFIDRIKLFEERELYLSDIGKDYLEKLKGAQNNNEKYLEQLKKDFPSVRNPHLEYFSPLLMADQIDPMLIFEWLEVLQISKGCSHLCNHCYYGAGMPVDVMPFYKIIQLLEAAKNTTENRLLGRSRPHYLNGIVLHHDNEIFDYYDPLYDADAGDVMSIILKYYPEQIINVTTRGWYTGDFIGLRAGKKIAKLMEIFSLYIRFSIDLYDTRGNIDRYIYRMVEVFNVFSEVIDIEQKLVFANVACDMGNIRKTEEIARIILYLNLIEKPFDQIEYNIISLSDRAEKQGVQSIEKYSIDSDLLGFHIAPS